VGELDITVSRFVANLQTEFASEIEADPRGFKQRLLELLKSALPLKHGRPLHKNITRAAEMRTWQKVATNIRLLHPNNAFRGLASTRRKSFAMRSQIPCPL
jgi:hypothetical protein